MATPPFRAAAFAKLSARCRRRASACRRTAACRPRRTRQRSDSLPCIDRLPHRGAAEHDAFDENEARHPPRDRHRCCRRQPRAVEQDGFLRQPAQRGAARDIDGGLRSPHPVHACGRSSRPPRPRRPAARPRPTSTSRSKRSPPAMPPAVLTITASHSPGSHWESARAASLPHARASRRVLPRSAAPTGNTSDRAVGVEGVVQCLRVRAFESPASARSWPGLSCARFGLACQDVTPRPRAFGADLSPGGIERSHSEIARRSAASSMSALVQE